MSIFLFYLQPVCQSVKINLFINECLLCLFVCLWFDCLFVCLFMYIITRFIWPYWFVFMLWKQCFVDIETQSDSSSRFLVRASFLQIYNEKLMDLLVRIFIKNKKPLFNIILWWRMWQAREINMMTLRLIDWEYVKQQVVDCLW